MSHPVIHPPDGGGLPDHRRRISPLPAPLDVIAVVSNPVRFRSRYDLYRAFEKHVLDSGARLTTVELAHGGRPFEITDPSNARHVQLRNTHELWLKENLVNIGIQNLPADWQYCAWVDADLQFGRSDWVQETLQQLQHYQFVQMWSHALDLGPDFEPHDMHAGFAYCSRTNPPGQPRPTVDAYGYGGPAGESPKTHYWHPGYAWAARREAIDKVGGLIDWAILGAADIHMAKALIGKAVDETPKGIHPNYVALLQRWQDEAVRLCRKGVGYVPGLILHYWHGAKVNRKYWDRWKILVNDHYDPALDIKRDHQGVLQLVDEGSERSIRLRDDIMGYFRQRQEDGTSTT